VVARRLAEGLLKGGGGNRTVGELLDAARSVPGLAPVRLEDLDLAPAGSRAGPSGLASPASNGGGSVAPVAASPVPAASTHTTTAPSESGAAVSDEALVLEPWIETARCTTCNECTNLNSRMFAYDENKQAYIRDARAGTFAHLVSAAERCPAGLIHPGTPLDPNEKDLEKWIARAAPFN
jgi:pyruvate-ferredoxin/flavodoxin oxidoreductase